MALLNADGTVMTQVQMAARAKQYRARHAEADQPPPPTWGEVAGASFQLHNTVGSSLAYVGDNRRSEWEPMGGDDHTTPWQAAMWRDPDFDVHASLDDLEAQYQPYLSDLSEARDETEFIRLKRAIRREIEAHDVLSRSSWLQYLTMNAVAIITDPVNFIPLGGWAVRGAKAAKAAKALNLRTMAARGATTAAGTETMAEVILHGSQYTRTAEDSMANIATAGALGGAFGTGVGAWSNWRRRKARAALDNAEARGSDLSATLIESVGEGLSADDGAAPTPRASQRPAPPIVKLKASDLHFDAERFQYKSGGDRRGVNDTLAEVKKWSEMSGGTILAWRDRSGKTFIVNGHQRLALAKRIEGETGKPVTLEGRVLLEIDGVSAAEARTLGAQINIGEGTGSVVDAARVLRASDRGKAPPVDDMALGQKGLAESARDIANLTDDLFALVEKGAMKPAYARWVGRFFERGSDQAEAWRILRDGKPKSAAEAEYIARQVESAGFDTKAAQTLFGVEDISESLFHHRGKVLARAMASLRKDKQVFAALERNAERIEGEGNVLAHERNVEIASRNAEILARTEYLAHSKGEISTALSHAARLFKETNDLDDAAHTFLDAIQGKVDMDAPLPPRVPGRVREALDHGRRDTPAKEADEGTPVRRHSQAKAEDGQKAEVEPKIVWQAPHEGDGGWDVDWAWLRGTGLTRLPAMGPMMKLLHSSSQVAKKFATDLADHNMILKRNRLGLATPSNVENHVAQWHGQGTDVLLGVEQAWHRYLRRIAGEHSARKWGLTATRLQTGTRRLRHAARLKRKDTLTLTQFHKRVALVAKHGHNDVIAEVNEAASAVRKFFEDANGKAAQAVLLPPDLKPRTARYYLPRMFDRGRVRRYRDRFEAIVTRWLSDLRKGGDEELVDLKDSDLTDMAGNITANVLGYQSAGRIHTRMAEILSGKQGPLLRREWNIPDAMIDEFLVNDVRVLIPYYLRTAIPDIEIAHTFGDLRLDQVMKAMDGEMTIRKRGLSSSAKNALEAEYKSLKKAMNDMALRERHALAEMPEGLGGKMGHKGVNLVRDFSYMAKAGWIGITNLGDLSAIPFTQGAMGAFGKDIWKFIKQVSIIGTHEARAAGVATDLIDNATANARMGLDDYLELADLSGGGIAAEGLRKAAEVGTRGRVATNWLNGMVWLNTTTKSIVANGTQHRALKLMRKMVNGTISKRKRVWLLKRAIDEDSANRILMQFDQFGTKTKYGALLANSREWTDIQAREAFHAMTYREVQQVISTPGQELPLWASRTVWGRFFTMLRSFALTTIQRQLIPRLQENPAAAVGWMLTNTVFYAGLTALTGQWLYGKARKVNLPNLIYDGVRRASWVGFLPEINRAGEILTRGRVGLGPALEVDRTYSEWEVGDRVLKTFLGPAFGTLSEAGAVAVALLGKDELTNWEKHMVRMLLPFTLLPYLRRTINEWEDDWREEEDYR